MVTVIRIEHFRPPRAHPDRHGLTQLGSYWPRFAQMVPDWFRLTQIRPNGSRLLGLYLPTFAQIGPYGSRLVHIGPDWPRFWVQIGPDWPIWAQIDPYWPRLAQILGPDRPRLAQMHPDEPRLAKMGRDWFRRAQICPDGPRSRLLHIGPDWLRFWVQIGPDSGPRLAQIGP